MINWIIRYFFGIVPKHKHRFTRWIEIKDVEPDTLMTIALSRTNKMGVKFKLDKRLQFKFCKVKGCNRYLMRRFKKKRFKKKRFRKKPS